jgi:hypothetical protein
VNYSLDGGREDTCGGVYVGLAYLRAGPLCQKTLECAEVLTLELDGRAMQSRSRRGVFQERTVERRSVTMHEREPIDELINALNQGTRRVRDDCNRCEHLVEMA